MAAVRPSALQDVMTTLLKQVDHLVYATTDLESSVTELERHLGVRAAPGGQHLGRGTRNALIALSDRSYLEIVGPDPAQTQVRAPRWLGVDAVTAPCLFTWAAKSSALQALVEEAELRGVRLGPVISGSRQATDGKLLRWQFTDPRTVVADGIAPFFIDWGDSPHPAFFAPRGLALVSLRGEHPDPAAVSEALLVVGVELPVHRGARPALIARLKTDRGEIELR